MFKKRYNPEKIKKENTKQLLKLGITVIDHLPYIEKTPHRIATEVSKRAIAMAALYQLAFSAPRDFVSDYIQENQLVDQLTKQEKELLETDYEDLDPQQKINLSWSVEAIWALAWVGKKHDNLTFNTPVEDSLAGYLPNFQANEPAVDFISSFKIRSESDTHKMLDLFYRAHWFARNNELNGKTSILANQSIIMERRTALEWACNSTVAWDEVELST